MHNDVLAYEVADWTGPDQGRMKKKNIGWPGVIHAQYFDG
jgi:hypothetical protein